MRRMHRFGSFLPLLLLCLPLSASERLAEKSGRENESEAIRERIRLYLQRHGDNGVIDPERRLKIVARDYAARREEEKLRRALPFGVGGDKWISLGPTNGAGRVTAVAPHPTQSGVVYVGTAGGGVWKTTDGGTSWIPLTDGLNDLSVGALAFAPSDPNTLYLGSGEGGYAIDFIPGIGLLTSGDGGATWSLPASVVASTFYRLSVHPSNPRELVAGTNQGGLRTTDGGATWTPVIPRTTYGDVVDIVRDPTNPSVLYAASWCVNACLNGIGKILKSTDGGSTWTDKSSGLPVTGNSDFRFNERLSLAISPSNPAVLYAATALTDAFGTITSHIYKSVNNADTWLDLTALSGSTDNRISEYLGEQSWYDNTIVVSPTDPNTVLAGGVRYVRTTDGGSTFSTPPFAGTSVHVDAHDLRYQGSTLYIGNDGGVWATPDNGATGASRNDGLVARQYYALAVDPSHRNRIIAGSQDNGTDQRTDAGGTAWRRVVGSDGFECAINPSAPDVAYGSIQFGEIGRSKNFGAAGQPIFSDIDPPFSGGEAGPFLTVLTMHPTKPTTIYTGSYRVWRSENGGDTWLPLPMTTTDGTTWSSTTLVTAIAVARSNPLVLMIAKSRQVLRSADGGKTWANASSGLSGAVVNNLEIDPSNANVAYAALATTTGASLFATVDGGATWASKSSGLPTFAAQVVRVDPTDPKTLYCGTDVGVYRSTDQGASWSKFGTGLPASSVHDLRIFEDASALRVATHGRGVWELDVPPTGNSPPVVQIAPAGPVTAARGSSVAFSGSVLDADGGDFVSGTWSFPDTWETVDAQGPAPVATHVFQRTGVFPVTLAGRDSHGSVATATTFVVVPEAADDCGAPIVLPARGPFPYTVIVNSEAATASATDIAVPAACAANAQPNSPSLWFEFTAAVSGLYEFSTCGGQIDTVLQVFTGPPCGPLTPVAAGCNDDAPSGTLCDGTTSSVASVFLVPGQTARVQVTGFLTTDLGVFPLTVRPRELSASIPRATALSRYAGSTAGGTEVSIYGFNFTGDTAVTFGGVAAAVTVLDPGFLTAVIPAHAAGIVDIVVSNSVGSGLLAGAFTYAAQPGAPACAASLSTLCLNAGRFRVQVAWRVPSQGTFGLANAVPITGDTGSFWFFSDNNLELVIKVVDGRAFNNKFWVFYGALSNVEYTITVTDTVTGAVKTYFNPAGTLASVADTAAFDGGSAAFAPLTQSKVQSPKSKGADVAAKADAACVASGTALCLNGGRFKVEVAWRVPAQGTSGVGLAVPLTSDTGYFWFFSANNIELVIKVVDGRAFNNKFWVFYGALSNVEYTITVTDTLTGSVKTYVNPFGQLASVADTAAF